MTALRSVFRGEPLGLETLAGNLDGHDARIVDLKADPAGYERTLNEFRPDIVGFTAMTCEANTVLSLAARAKEGFATRTVVGGIHATLDPEHFNRPAVDYVVRGLGKLSFRMLVDALAAGDTGRAIPGVGRVTPGQPLRVPPRDYSVADLVEESAPRYDLTKEYRPDYTLPSLGVSLGCVATSFGCPHRCDFCCVGSLTGGKYLAHSAGAVVRDVRNLGPAGLIRLTDSNSFGSLADATSLCNALLDAGLAGPYLADVRADTIVKHPDMLKQWRRAGLRAAVVGFEETRDDVLAGWHKGTTARMNGEAVRILHDTGIMAVADFIVSPDYTEADFDSLERCILDMPGAMPVLSVLTPLPGTPLFSHLRDRITNHDLDYYTLTNAVWPPRLGEERFYKRFTEVLQRCHRKPAFRLGKE